MAQAFTGAGSALYAQRQIAGLPLIIDRVSIGTLGAGDRYDAVATQSALVDTTPTNFSTQFDLIANGPWVILTLTLDAADAITASEIGLFSGGTLVMVVASASVDVFVKVAGTAQIFSFLWQIVNGQPTTPTITVSPYAIASQPQAIAGLLNNVLSSPLRVANYVTAWWTTNGTKLSLRNIISMATSQAARAGTGDGVMTSELTATAIASQTGGLSPSGAILSYAGLSAPTGWFLCDGSAINRVIYAGLFSVIGTLWGDGNGSHYLQRARFQGPCFGGSGWSPQSSFGRIIGRSGQQRRLS